MTPRFLDLAVKWMELPFTEMGRTVGEQPGRGDWKFDIKQVRSNIFLSIQMKTPSRQFLIGLWDSGGRPCSSQNRRKLAHG